MSKPHQGAPRWVRAGGALLLLGTAAAALFGLSRLEVSVEPDALRAPLVAELATDARLGRACPGAASSAPGLRVGSVHAKRPFVGSDGSGHAFVVVPLDPPCRLRVAFRLTHRQGGHHAVRVTAVERLEGPPGQGAAR